MPANMTPRRFPPPGLSTLKRCASPYVITFGKVFLSCASRLTKHFKNWPR